MNLFSTSLGCLAFAVACPAQVPNWTKFNTTPTPEWRQNFPMVYDSARGVCVMFGGYTSTAGGTRNAGLDDTWEWDGKSWTQINPPTKPPRWAAHCMAYDSKRQRTVVTGNGVAATWEYDGTTWMDVTPATQPSIPGHRPMTYDSGRGVCVAFGNINGVNETWEYDGTNWQKIATPTTPMPPQGSCSLAYDSLRRVTVMFASNSQTWEYDGTDWTQAAPATAPPGRSCSYGMVYDDARQVVVMFGGCSGFGDTWEYDGVDWRQHQTANAPPTERRYLGMAYDSKRRRTVFFGGRDFSGASPVVTNDTWEYSRGDCFMIPNTGTISITAGGTQRLAVDAGTAHAFNQYWIFGSMTGTSPGLPHFGPHIFLNADVYTDLVIALTNTSFLMNFRGVLDASGKATADFVLPPGIVQSAFNVHHAAFVWQTNLTCSTNPVALQLK